MFSFNRLFQRRTARPLSSVLLAKVPTTNVRNFSTITHPDEHPNDASFLHSDHYSSINHSPRSSELNTFSTPRSSCSNLKDSVQSSSLSQGPTKDRFPYPSVNLTDPRRRLAVLIDGTNDNLLRNCQGIGATASILAWIEEAARETSLVVNVLPAILKIGVPVLLRVFGHQLPVEWEPLVLSGSDERRIKNGKGGRLVELPLSLFSSCQPTPTEDNGGDSDDIKDHSVGSSKVLPIQVEFFRVERFIPIPMQIEADAQHLYSFRNHNKIEGVFYVCQEMDFAMYEKLMVEKHCLIQQSLESSFRSNDSENFPCFSSKSFFDQYLIDELGTVKSINIDDQSTDSL
ncbi:unnamed protein product, partial [Phytomonas sp. Hart1]